MCLSFLVSHYPLFPFLCIVTFFLARLLGTWDLSSSTKDCSCAPLHWKGQSLNPWAPREVPIGSDFKRCFQIYWHSIHQAQFPSPWIRDGLSDWFLMNRRQDDAMLSDIQGIGSKAPSAWTLSCDTCSWNPTTYWMPGHTEKILTWLLGSTECLGPQGTTSLDHQAWEWGRLEHGPSPSHGLTATTWEALNENHATKHSTLGEVSAGDRHGYCVMSPSVVWFVTQLSIIRTLSRGTPGKPLKMYSWKHCFQSGSTRYDLESKLWK